MPKSTQPTSRASRPAGWLARLHGDDRGNLAILLILTIWALVALIALVWNSAEYATRRRHVQNAADAMAHAGNTWVSRTTNLTASTNVLMSENGSAEVIRRSIEPTRAAIQKEYDWELTRAYRIREGATPGEPETIPDCEYFEELLGFGQWGGKGRGDERIKELQELKSDLLNALAIILRRTPEPAATQLRLRVADNLRKHEVGLNWLVGTWVGGGPGEPAAPGNGLRKDVGDWITGQVRTRLEDIIATIAVEQSWLDRWTAQTDPAMGTSPEDLRRIRGEMYEYQTTIRDLTPQVIDEQREALSTFYKTDITAATPGRPASAGGAASIDAPVRPASEVDAWPPHADSIRNRYPQRAADRFRYDSDPLNVKVDAINVNVARGVRGTEDSVIWHPGQTVYPPPGIVLEKQTYSEDYNVGESEWGRVPCAPLSRFFNDRVYRDREGLREEPRQIDRVRTDLRGRVHPPAQPPAIPTLPRTIKDPAPVAPPQPGQPPATISISPPHIGQLPTNTPGLTPADIAVIEAINARTAQHNGKVDAFVDELRRLTNPTRQMYNQLEQLTDRASQTFADRTYLGHVESSRRYVLNSMGWDKQFMVLKTYELREIPDWAKSGMRDSVQKYTYQRLYDGARARLEREARQRIRAWAERILGAAEDARVAAGGAAQGAGAIRSQAQQFADANAPRAAEYMASRAARGISQEVAEEWIARPWPFEIDAPKESVPPNRGLTDDERKRHFTFLAAAKTKEGSEPTPFMPAVFEPGKPMVAFAQGETFNWMEYHRDYGDAPSRSDSADHYDQIVQYGHGDLGGSPRPWRLSTTGGWNWQPRLALSDALDMAVTDGPEFQEYLDESGVTGTDPEAFKKLPMH